MGKSQQTLNYFCIIEILLGIWMLFPDYVSQSFVTQLQQYLPLWILGFIFAGSGFFNLFFPEHFKTYVCSVSTPLSFLGLVFFQTAFNNGSIAPGTILCLSMGVYSAILAGQVLQNGN